MATTVLSLTKLPRNPVIEHRPARERRQVEVEAVVDVHEIGINAPTTLPRSRGTTRPDQNGLPRRQAGEEHFHQHMEAHLQRRLRERWSSGHPGCAQDRDRQPEGGEKDVHARDIAPPNAARVRDPQEDLAQYSEAAQGQPEEGLHVEDREDTYGREVADRDHLLRQEAP